MYGLNKHYGQCHIVITFDLKFSALILVNFPICDPDMCLISNNSRRIRLFKYDAKQQICYDLPSTLSSSSSGHEECFSRNEIFSVMLV